MLMQRPPQGRSNDSALLTALLAALLTTGCASTPPERDARGHPRIEPMSAAQLARLEPSTPSPPAQTAV